MKAIIYNPHTGVIVGRFASHEDAQAWLDSYGVSQRYKDENYCIELAETYYMRHGKVI